ncbi:MAG TPA: hypothetical protein VHZ97_22185 [Pseudonocardiaceae bacterium]|jgi:uncharacterized phage infection (PIP) family protein YhgE|nr:hypothetical protein [Pseudonocardiaceae bacterium]
MRVNISDLQVTSDTLGNGIPAARNTPAATLSAASPLSQALATVQNTKAGAATQFVNTVRQGVTQAASTLTQIASELQQLDQGSANGIMQVMPAMSRSADG